MSYTINLPDPEPAASPGEPQQELSDDSPWYFKYGVTLLGSVASIAAVVLGIFAFLKFTPRCVLAGIIQILAGILVALIEVPTVCMCLDSTQATSTFFDGKPPWLRGVLYIFISIAPVLLCVGFATMLGSSLIFVTGIRYALISLRRRVQESLNEDT